MIDVHLIGYTADLRYVVLDLDAEAGGRYRLVVDPDLFATLLEIHELRVEAGLDPPGSGPLPVDDDGDIEDWDEVLDEDDDLDDTALFAPLPDAAPAPQPLLADVSIEDEVDTAGAPLSFIDAHLERAPFEDRVDERSPFAPPAERTDEGADGAGTHEGVRIVRPPEPLPGPDDGTPLFEESLEDEEDEAAVAEVADPDPGPDPEPEPPPPPPAGRPATKPTAVRKEPAPPPPPREPKLTPAEIQALLRSGKSPRTVAEQAGTDEAWIERWLPPILEERARVLRDAQSLKLERPRLGRSRDALGDAVRKGLKARKVDPTEAAWETTRRSDGRWKVSVKFRHRGRSRTASWLFDPRERELDAASDLARELGFTRRRNGTAPKGTGGKPRKKSAPRRGGSS